MQTSLKKIKRHRKFSDDFKREIVAQFESGSFTVLQLCKLHNLSDPMVYDWIYKYSTFNEKNTVVVEMKNSSTQKLKELEKRNKELERIVGQKQIMIDYLEEMIKIASEDLKTDIKKNIVTPQSKPSEKKEQN